MPGGGRDVESGERRREGKRGPEVGRWRAGGGGAKVERGGGAEILVEAGGAEGGADAADLLVDCVAGTAEEGGDVALGDGPGEEEPELALERGEALEGA